MYVCWYVCWYVFWFYVSTKFLQLEFMFYPKIYPHVCRIMEPTSRVLQVAGRETPLPRQARRITMPQLGETQSGYLGTKREWAVAVKIVKWLRNSISFCSFWWYLISELVTNHFFRHWNCLETQWTKNYCQWCPKVDSPAALEDPPRISSLEEIAG